MAFEIINPAASAWLANGLTHILFPEDQLEELGRPREKEPPKARVEKPASAIIPPRQPEARPAMPGKTGTAPAWQPLPMENWPAIWQERFRNTKRGKIAWTYWNLGPDLLAGKSRADDPHAAQRAERSQFMRRLLKDLAKPAGTHTFWPAHLDPGPDPVIESALFWSGVTALGCRSVIIMGSRTARPLLNQSGLMPLSQVREKGHLVWILRDIDGFPPAEYERMLVFLKQRLAAIGI